MTAYSQFSDVPMFRYGLIMADPPWSFQHWGDATEKSAETKYDVMTYQDIVSMPVRDLLAPDAYLWLWVHPSFPPSASERVLKAWGCNFVTMGYWGKVTKSKPTRPHIGLGHVLRDAGEPFFIGSVGTPGVHDKGIPSLLLDHRREHSRKPESAYDLANRLAPPHSWKLDLFSRQEREGWDCFGNETDKFEAI